MFSKTLNSPTQSAVIPGAGPQLPNDNEAGRFHYIWDVYNPDTVKPGEESRYRVPKEKEMVVDPIAQQWYIVSHVNWEGDLRSTLEPIFNSGGDGNSDPLNSIFGLPAGYQGEAIVGIDYSVRPNRAVVDGQVMAPGAAYALLYEGNTVGENGKVISVVYGSNNEMISNRIPATLAAHHDLTNKEIMVTQPFSVNRNAEELPDGSRATLVWFDHTGNMIPKARSLTVQHTAMLRDHQVGKRYIRKVELLAPWFLNSGDPKTLNVPVNTVLQNLAFRAMVHYSDGSKSEELPIDGQKVILHGLNEHKPSTPGQRGTLTLVYNLDPDEYIYEAQPGNPNQYRDSYSLLAVDFDGAYSPKLYSYPTWVNGQYQLKHYLTDLDRSFIIDATDYVRINELSPAFRPTTYGVEQTIELNLRLSDVVPTFEPMIMRQSTTFILKAPGNEDGSKFDVRYSYDQSAYNDPTFKAVNQADGRQQIEFGKGYESQDEWLEDTYYAVEPSYNTQREKGPMKPTHFEIEVSSGKVYSYTLSKWADKLYLDVQEPQGRTIFVRWVYESIQGERLLLATTGVSIDVVEGPSTETPEPTSIELDREVVGRIGLNEVFAVSGVVYDQFGKPMKDGLTNLMVRGGVFHDKSPRKVPVKIDGSFRFYTWSEKPVGETETIEFAFETGKAPVYILEKDIEIIENENTIVSEFYPYSPTKVGVNKPARAYGYLEDDEQNRLRDFPFYSMVGDDLDTIRAETTDENGDFLLTRFHTGDEKVAVMNIKAGGTDDVRVLTWVETESYGDRITLDQIDWTFVGTDQLAVTGRVYDQFGELVQGVTTTFGFGPQWNPANVTTTASKGTYVLNHAYMEPGNTYDIVVWTDNDFAFGTATWEKEVIVADRIVLDSENPTEAPAGTTVAISGKLVDAEGNDFVSEGQTPIKVTRLGSGESDLIYAGIDGRFETQVGPFKDWEVTTFLFELEGKAPVTHTITWMGEPARLDNLKFDAGLPRETKLGLPALLEGETVDQHGKLFAPGTEFEFDVEYGNGNVAKAHSMGDGRWSFKASSDVEGDIQYTFKSNTRVVGTFTVKFEGEIFIRPLPNVDLDYRIPVGETMTIGWYVVDENGDVMVGQRIDIVQRLPVEKDLGYGITDKYGKFEYTVPYYQTGFGEIAGFAGEKEATVELIWTEETDIAHTISSFNAPQFVYNGVTPLVRAVVSNEEGDPVPTGRLMCYNRDDYSLVTLQPYDPDNLPPAHDLNDWAGVLGNGEQAFWVDPLPEGKHNLVFFSECDTKVWPITWRVYDKVLSRIELADDTATKALTPVDAPTVYIRGTGVAGDESVYQPSTPTPVTWEGSDGSTGNTVVNTDGSIGFYIHDVVGAGTVVYTIKDGSRILTTFEIEYINGTVTELPYSQTFRFTGESARVAWGVRDEHDRAVAGLTLLKAINPEENEIYTNGITDEWGIMELVLGSDDAVPGTNTVVASFNPDTPTNGVINTPTVLSGTSQTIETTSGVASVFVEAQPRTQTVTWYDAGTTDPLMADVTDVTFIDQIGYGRGEVRLTTGVSAKAGESSPTEHFFIFDKGSFDYVDCGTASDMNNRPPYYEFGGDGSLSVTIAGGSSWNGTRHLLFATGYDIREETIEWVGEAEPVVGLRVLPYSNTRQVYREQGFVAIAAMGEYGNAVPNIPVTISLRYAGLQSQTVLTDENGIAEFILPGNDEDPKETTVFGEVKMEPVYWDGDIKVLAKYTNDFNEEHTINWTKNDYSLPVMVRWSDHTDTVGAGSDAVVAVAMGGFNDRYVPVTTMSAFNKRTLQTVTLTKHDNDREMFYGHLAAQSEGEHDIAFYTESSQFTRTITWLSTAAVKYAAIGWMIPTDTAEVVGTGAETLIDGKLMRWTPEEGEQRMRIQGPVEVSYRRTDDVEFGTAWAMPDGTISIPVEQSSNGQWHYSFVKDGQDIATKAVKFISGATVTYAKYSQDVAIRGGDVFIAAYVKDAAGNGVPNATVEFRLNAFPNVPISKVRTDRFGIAESTLRWGEFVENDNVESVFGDTKSEGYITWVEVNDPEQYPASFGILNIVRQAELPNPLSVNGTVLTQNGNQSAENGWAVVFSKEKLELVDLSDSLTSDGMLNATYGPFLEGTNNVVFALNMHHQNEQVVWNARPMVLADLRPSEYLSDFWTTNSDMVVTGTAHQLDGTPFTPTEETEFDAVNSVSGAVIKGVIDTEGNWTVTLTHGAEDTVIWKLTPADDNDIGMGDITVRYHDNVVMHPAPYSSSDLHFGKEATLAYGFKDNLGNPVVGGTFGISIEGNGVLNAKATTDEYGVATFRVPYIVDRDRVTAIAVYAGKRDEHNVDWSSDSILLPTSFSELTKATGIALGDLFNVSGKVIDQRGNPISSMPVGLYDRHNYNYNQSAVDSGSKLFDVEIGPWDQAGVKDMILYTGSYYEEVSVEVIDGLITIDRVNVDESSNKYILIENGEVLPKPFEIRIDIAEDSPPVGIVDDTVTMKGSATII